MKRLLLLLTILMFFLASAGADSTLLEQGRAAEIAENYQSAIDLYRQAMKADEQDPEPAKALAELFSAKGLHDLALPAWEEVVRRAPGEPGTWLSLAQTWSFLDDNQRSVTILTEAQSRFPQEADLVQALAWMLFKTEDFRRGISLIEAYQTANGTDRNLEMTLGTLYSSIFDYDLSRIHYLKSIELARGSGFEERNFRSIAWYNLSLLEKAFYQFELADQAIRQSVDEEDRPAGSLAWGELYQGRREFSEARRLYEKAVEADETPLARFDLARLFQQFGFLDEAEAQLVQVERHKDDTWIYNYGVTKDKIRRDLHELRADLHRARFYSLDFTARETPWDWLVWAVAKVREWLLSWYYDQSWKSLLVKLSQSSVAVRNSPEAWVGLTLAHRQRPELALKYLSLVRNHELPKNPRAQGAYLIEEGIIRRDPVLLEKAMQRTQIPWENEDRERALAVLIEVRRGSGQTIEGRRLLGILFALNPGGLATRGWGLPVRFSVYGGDEKTRSGWKTSLEAFALQSGWDLSGADRPGVSWTLDLRTGAAATLWSLRNSEGTVFRSGAARTAVELFRQIHTP